MNGCGNIFCDTRIRRFPYTSHGPPVALEALQCGPSAASEKRYFGEKSIRSLEKIQILALKMAVFYKNVALEQIWVGHGCLIQLRFK
jgi:hypothetical protein